MKIDKWINNVEWYSLNEPRAKTVLQAAGISIDSLQISSQLNMQPVILVRLSFQYTEKWMEKVKIGGKKIWLQEERRPLMI